MKSKTEVAKVTKEYIGQVEKQKEKSIRTIQSDNGTEFNNENLNSYLNQRGITRRLTVPHNPEQNGTAERKNRTLLDTARCLLFEANLPNSYWTEAVNTANYIRNRLPTKSLNGKTPYEAWTGEVPDLSHLRVFGSHVFYLDRDPARWKLSQRGHEGRFLGYSEESKAFRIWSLKKNKIIISRDVKFIENKETSSESKIPSKGYSFVDIEHNSPHESEDLEDIFPRESEDLDHTLPRESEDIESDDNESFRGFEREENQRDDPDEEAPNAGGTPESKREPGRPKGSGTKSGTQKTIPRQGTRTGLRSSSRQENHQGGDREQIEMDEGSEQIFLSEIPMKEAIAGSDVKEWHHAIAGEMKSLIKNKTWTLVDHPDQEKVIGSRMILRNKLKPDGIIDERKARLIAHGFSQQPGIHFKETFAPVTKISSVRLMASLAAQHNLKIRQFDVASAYLNGDLEKKVI